jgi:hypothetical protein
MRFSLTILHYGTQYLAWALRSVEPAVDAFLVAYTDRPSHGQATEAVCPEAEEDLRREAIRFVKKPIHWIKGRWTNEGLHRQAAFEAAKNLGAKHILVLDADEIWDPQTASDALDWMSGKPEAFARVQFVHFWRSFRWMCEDPSWPSRLLNVGGQGEQYLSDQKWPVLHFGYCQSESITRYKIETHGHKNEWRKNWLEEKFLGWKPGDVDCHPTCGLNAEGVPFWTPKPTPAPILGKIRELLYDHPYLNLDLIR